MDDELHWLAEVAAGQHGAVTARQVGAAGLTPRQIRRRIDNGVLDRVGAHVLRSPFVQHAELADVAAFMLDCGPGAVASGPTAAALHQLDGIGLHPPYHAMIPRGRNVQRREHRVHTTLELDPVDCTRGLGIPVFAVPRCLIDLPRFVGARTLTAAYDSALRDRRTTEEAVHERIVALRSKGRHGIPKLIDVIEGSEAARGGHSWLERRFLELCARAGLPRPVPQQPVTTTKGRLVRVDFVFSGTSVVVEVLGYRWHRGDRDQMSRDVERLNAMVLRGLRPMQFTYDHVTAEPAWVIAQVSNALDSASV